MDPSSIRIATIFPCEPVEVLTLTGDEYVDALASHEVGTNSKMHSAFALPRKEVLDDINNTPPALRSAAQVEIMTDISLRISFFHQVSSAAVKKLARVMRVMAYEGGDIIYKEGIEDLFPTLLEVNPDFLSTRWINHDRKLYSARGNDTLKEIPLKKIKSKLGHSPGSYIGHHL